MTKQVTRTKVKVTAIPIEGKEVIQTWKMKRSVKMSQARTWTLQRIHSQANKREQGRSGRRSKLKIKELSRIYSPHSHTSFKADNKLLFQQKAPLTKSLACHLIINQQKLMNRLLGYHFCQNRQENQYQKFITLSITKITMPCSQSSIRSSNMITKGLESLYWQRVEK